MTGRRQSTQNPTPLTTGETTAHPRAIGRREFLRAGAATAGALAIAPWSARPVRAQNAPAPGRKPSIVVFLADDLGYADLGCQGCKDIPTPNIDSIAANGVRFTDGHVSAPLCSPSRAGLMCGRYQQRSGFEHNSGPEAYAADNFGLDRKELTIAERLKPLGYATGMFGKWHIGFKPGLQPIDRGFDEYFGFLSGANDYIANLRRATNPILRGREVVEEKEYLTDAFCREAVAFIEKHHAAPFFVYLPFNAVHSPLQATDKYLKRFEAIADPNRRAYAAMLSAMDDNVGRVLDKLREHKLEEQTLIFFLSDNGGPTRETTSRNDPLRGYKVQMWEGGQRIPFMVQWKGRIPAGKVYDYPVISLDIHPTAVVAAGGEIAPEWKLDGVNLLPYLTGENASKPHETLYWRMGPYKRAIRHGDWKMVVEPELTKPALFNLAQDLGERNDLADKMPEKLKELTALYDAWDAQLEQARWIRQDAQTQGVAPAGARKGLLRRGAQGKAPDAGDAAPGAGLQGRFAELDKNGDGKLTPDEVPQPQLFRRMDANGDGSVTPEEARAAFPGGGAGRRAAGAGAQ